MSEKTIATKSRGIIFSAEMVRAILDGTKTQTRRAVKPQPHYSEPHKSWMWASGRGTYNMNQRRRETTNRDSGVVTVEEYAVPIQEWLVSSDRCPYRVGETFWVRETWCPRSGGMLAMDAICKPRYRADGELRPEWGFKWKSPYHMPRQMSRITLEITSIRVERLCDISEADAIAEGLPSKLVNDPLFKPDAREYWSPLGWCMTPEIAYEALWDSLNRSRAPWSSNPWVWVITFKRLPEVPDAR